MPGEEPPVPVSVSFTDDILIKIRIPLQNYSEEAKQNQRMTATIQSCALTEHHAKKACWGSGGITPQSTTFYRIVYLKA
jgi:hypothetical protein